ncbi:uncharacterized protein PGTG_08216 [Puccinia graminis f. sp. tritici CRL 75-36-700-3]|uniref:DUF4219 domain-containing protein n=2 Tax=Puccinia graminis f. sp. tritici TaxID=56615 RepID=E3KBV5_PUCGT|nr:uncharacterized protein PGTG_08216 [Puccinia graminis f. sp. tritici CRL 75-36-700-3]EFP81967.1 hypothetical protein PGTG_08216 [Puccinia graminis f. sp. tritici CRL 75-36-700-3]
MSGTEKHDTPASNGVPVLDGSNYTNWHSRMFIFLRGKKLWKCCTVPIAEDATEEERTAYEEAGDKAISIITSRINHRCYNKVVNSLTDSDPIALWKKIASQYASHSVINRGRVVRLKSGDETLLLNGEGDDGVASSALLCYQNNKTTKLSLAVIFIVIEDSSR